MRRMAPIASLLLVALVLAVAACGGDDESSTAAPVDEWASGFCTAVTGWTDDLQQIAESLNDPSSLNVDVLQEAGQDASDATDAFVDELRALGSPDTESGNEIESSLETLSDTLETEKNDLSAALEDVESLTDLPSAVSAIGTSLTAMGSAFQNALEALESSDVDGELETAFENSDACDEFSGDEGGSGG